MGTAKLMTLLFYDGNYNVEKKRMRAVLEREVSNGAVSYRLWRSDGKPDLEYPRAANDAYILHVEVNDHLVPPDDGLCLGESLRVTSSNDCLVWFQRRQRGAFQTPEGFRCRRHRSFHGSDGTRDGKDHRAW